MGGHGFLYIGGNGGSGLEIGGIGLWIGIKGGSGFL